MKWSPSVQVEGLLNRIGVEYEWQEAFRFADIDLKKSAENQARIVHAPIMEDVVMQYGIAMLDSDANFPGPVVWKNCKAYILADGNQRCNAFVEAGFAKRSATIGCYVLNTDDQQTIELVTRSLNRVNGIGQDTEEALQQCVRMLEKYPDMTQQELLTRFHLKAEQLARAMRYKATCDALLRAGVKADVIPSTTVSNQLHRLINQEPVLVYAARLAVDYDLSGDAVKEIVDDAKSRRSESESMGIVAKHESRLSARFARKGQRARRVKEQFRRALGGVLRIVAKHPTREALQLTAEGDFNEFAADWDKLRSAIDKVFANANRA